MLKVYKEDHKEFDSSNENLIKNDSFSDADNDGARHWVIPDPNDQIVLSNNSDFGNYVRASQNSPITQKVLVEPNKMYKLTIFCKKDGIEGKYSRPHILWYNNDKYLSYSIKVIEITDKWEKYEMIVISPGQANIGVVHINTHEDYYVCFDNVSLTDVK